MFLLAALWTQTTAGCFSPLMPWEELEETYASQFNPTTGAPAKPVRLAFGALFIKQRLGLTDEETVE
jgi:IS5 family transposase